MTFDLTTFDLTAMPTTFDLLHLILAGAALLFLILGVTKRSGSSADAAAPVSHAPSSVSDKTLTPEPEPESTPEPAPALLREASPEAALQLLSLLQQEARLIDFVKEDLSGFSDADIGAAARVVHEGSLKALNSYFTLVPVRDEAEESQITLAEGFDASEVRLTGNVVGQAPFTGTLVHRGWKVAEVTLPKLAEGHDARVIAPAEVEL